MCFFIKNLFYTPVASRYDTLKNKYFLYKMEEQSKEKYELYRQEKNLDSRDDAFYDLNTPADPEMSAIATSLKKIVIKPEYRGSALDAQEMIIASEAYAQFGFKSNIRIDELFVEAKARYIERLNNLRYGDSQLTFRTHMLQLLEGSHNFKAYHTNMLKLREDLSVELKAKGCVEPVFRYMFEISLNS